MRSSTQSESVRAKLVVGAIALVAVSFTLFYLLFFDPWGLHPIDSWLQARLHYHAGDPGDLSTDEVRQLWTCSMHPHILEDEPGICPVCRMDLVPVRGGGQDSPPSGSTASSGEREILFYRNPMDPSVTSPVPTQDEMGMEYVAVYADEIEKTVDSESIVRINPAVVQNMNVRTALVERRDLSQEIRTVGYLEYDQERMVSDFLMELKQNPLRYA